MPIKAWHTVGTQKRWLLPLVSAPLPLSPWRHSLRPIFLGGAEPSTGVPTQLLPVCAAHGRGSHLCGRFLTAPSPLGHGDPNPRVLRRVPSPVRRPGQGDRHIILWSPQPCAARGPCRCPLSAGAGTRHRARFLVTPAGATGHPCTCCSSSQHAAVPLTSSAASSSATRCPPKFLCKVRVPEPPTAQRCGIRANTGGGPVPGVPGAAAGGGDGKRKRWGV